MRFMTGDSDIAAVAAVIGDPARSRMLTALLAGPPLPRRRASRRPPASHVDRERAPGEAHAAGLVTAVPIGRHRYHRLAGHEVAEVGRVSRCPRRRAPSARCASPTATAEARRALLLRPPRRRCSASRSPTRSAPRARCEPRSRRPARPGRRSRSSGSTSTTLASRRRPLTRLCIDWTERRPHLAGALGAAVLDTCLEPRLGRPRPAPAVPHSHGAKATFVLARRGRHRPPPHRRRLAETQPSPRGRPGPRRP